MIICKSADEIRLMRKAAEIVAEVLLQLEESLKPGYRQITWTTLQKR